MPQRRSSSSRLPSPLVFLLISTHFTATPGILPASPRLEIISFKCSLRVEPEVFTPDLMIRPRLFTPSKSEQRLHHTYYRGCWHVVSRCFQQVPSLSSSLSIALYNPKAFIAHAASLRQACAHCARFLTAASRRSLGRVSVPVWPDTLSGRLLIVALVGRYPANKLISRRLILQRIAAFYNPTDVS